jgi:Fe2+ transport system protein FeoA
MLLCLDLYAFVFTGKFSKVEAKAAGLGIASWLLMAGGGRRTSKVMGEMDASQLHHSRTIGGEFIMYQTNNEFTTIGNELIPSHKSLPLSLARKGSRLRIISIPEGRGRTQLIRLGFMKGEVVQCIERLPGGTVVIEKNRQEIAIGASLAKTIIVDSAGAEEGFQSPR